MKLVLPDALNFIKNRGTSLVPKQTSARRVLVYVSILLPRPTDSNKDRVPAAPKAQKHARNTRATLTDSNRKAKSGDEACFCVTAFMKCLTPYLMTVTDTQ